MLKRFLSSAMLAAAMLAMPLATNSVQAAKITTKTRIIKVYMPKKTYTRIQRARVHKGRKSHWNKYKAPSVKGYTPSRAFVPRATVKYTTKNKIVKITYKLKKKKHIVVNYINEKKLALKIINSFRAKVGVKPVKLNNYYSSVLDKRATAKAKQLATTDDYDHSNYMRLPIYLNTYPLINGKVYEHGGEILHAAYLNGDSIYNRIADTFTDNMQAEKDDYIAIKIKHTKKTITNISGTIDHYTMMVDGGSHQAFIGVGQYGGSMCLVIEMHR